MQIVDDRATAEIEVVLAQAAITSATALPSTHMGKSMLNGHPFPQLDTSLRGLLALAQLDKQGFIGVNTYATPFCTGRALGLQRRLRAGVFGKMNDPTGHKGHFSFRWTANDLPLPIQRKRLLVLSVWGQAELSKKRTEKTLPRHALLLIQARWNGSITQPFAP